jgi:hypothetical protein
MEKVTHPALELSNISHAVFEVSPFVNLFDEAILPGVKLDALDVSKRHIKIVSSF